MVYNGLRNGLNSIVSSIMANITVLMGVVMIIYALLGLYWDFEYGENMLVSIVVYAFPLVLGIMILMDRHRSVFFAVGMYAIALGIARFMSYCPMIFDNNMLTEVTGLVFTVMAANLVYSGFRYILSNSRGVFWVCVGSGLFAALLTVEIIMYFMTEPNLDNFIVDEGDNTVTLAMILLYLMLVVSYPVRNSTDLARMSSAFGGYRLTNVSGPDISVDPETVTFILHFCDGTMPESDMTGLREGPVYYEYIFPFHDGMRYGTIFLRRWYGPDGPVYMTFSEHKDGSVIGTNTMRVIDVMVSGNRLIFGFDGSRTGVFRIRRPDEENGPLFYSNRPKGAA